MLIMSVTDIQGLHLTQYSGFTSALICAHITFATTLRACLRECSNAELAAWYQDIFSATLARVRTHFTHAAGVGPCQYFHPTPRASQVVASRLCAQPRHTC